MDDETLEKAGFKPHEFPICRLFFEHRRLDLTTNKWVKIEENERATDKS